MQDVSNGKERKTHPSCDVDASGDANDGHNSLNCCNPQFLHSLSTHFPLLFFLQNTQQHPPRSRIELQTNGSSFKARTSPLERQNGDIESRKITTTIIETFFSHILRKMGKLVHVAS
jgi:hypothetical protein